MCHPACMKFGESHLFREEIMGRKVLEVGALDINGSLRNFVCRMEPSGYLGIDIVSGSGVDEICDVSNLMDRYGRESFDMVICTEVMEHIRDWRKAISNLKNVLKPDGIMILTARSNGFPHHSFPSDFWRFETDDINMIFGDMIIEANEKDPEIPGVFVKVRKPAIFVEKNLSDFALYSIIRSRNSKNVNEFHIFIFKVKSALRKWLSLVLPAGMKATVRKLVVNKFDI